MSDVSGVLSAREIRRTGEYIASQQLPSGLIPWFTGHHADPWDHVEAAMALAVAGLRDEARRAYEWSAGNQTPQGGWPMELVSREGSVLATDPAMDANQAAYLAVGVWHHWRVTGDRRFVDDLWPAVRRAVDLVCDLQQGSGAVSWAISPAGRVDDRTLLTGNACLVLSLRCALALAELVGDPRPDWEMSAARLVHAVAAHPGTYEDNSRFSMDWYYPMLGSALRGRAARDAVDRRWDEFVVPGLGVRCVSDRPWVTAAETCELVLTLQTMGDTTRAQQLLSDIQICRDEDGGYWTGWVWPEDVFWPEEKSTWTAAAVVLAADALGEHSSAHDLFRDGALPKLWRPATCDVHCQQTAGTHV